MPQRYATLADLTAIAPVMDAVLEATRTTFLEATQSLVDLPEHGARASTVHALWTAHLLAMTNQPGSGAAGGDIASKSIGSLSISYAVSGSADPELGATRWGRMLLAMTDGLGGIGVVGRTGDPFALTGGRT